MNRKDREVTIKKEVIDILERCDTIRLGLVNGKQPYIVPVSFGVDYNADRTVIYIHSAKKGLKIDCIKQNNSVCVEGDIFYKVEPFEKGITARYESVIGFGTIAEIDGDEKVYGLSKILDHYKQNDYPPDRCGNLSYVSVYKIVLDNITGKRNLPSRG